MKRETGGVCLTVRAAHLYKCHSEYYGWHTGKFGKTVSQLLGFLLSREMYGIVRCYFIDIPVREMRNEQSHQVCLKTNAIKNMQL